MRLPALIAALVALLTPVPAMATDEPDYTLVREDGAIQLRDYAPMIIAHVRVEGDRGSATNRGFRPLAGYIFGGNAPRESIAMTAPVTATRDRGQSIDMTAPVTAERSGDAWSVAFVMPAQWTMDTLPVPDNPDVTLSDVPARRMAVIRFNGGGSESRLASKQAELEAWIAQAGLTAIGEPVFAFYDPPWVLGPFRRNEVMIEVAGG